MLGGGFIGQMGQTNKQNREMLKKEQRKPFGKTSTSGKDEKETSILEHRELTDVEKESIRIKVRADEKKEERKKLTILLISLISTVIVFGVLYWLFADAIIAFGR